MRILTIEEVDAVSGAHKSSFEYKFKYSTSTKEGKNGESKTKTKIECKIKIKGHDFDLSDLPALPDFCSCSITPV